MVERDVLFGTLPAIKQREAITPIGPPGPVVPPSS